MNHSLLCEVAPELMPTGNLPLDLKCDLFEGTIYSGPFRSKPDYIEGVNLTEEIDLPALIRLPIVDFSVPEYQETVFAMVKACNAMDVLGQLYAGCWGGRGRTGIFLALMTKVAMVANGEDPEHVVPHIRAAVSPHLVETAEQQAFVRDFPADQVVGLMRDLRELANSLV